MPAPVVHVVDVIAVRHCDVATPVAVDVAVVLVHGVAGRLAFVVVAVVLSVQVPVVHEVHVIPVRYRDVAAAVAVDMLVSGVGAVGCAGHCLTTVA